MIQKQHQLQRGVTPGKPLASLTRKATTARELTIRDSVVVRLWMLEEMLEAFMGSHS